MVAMLQIAECQSPARVAPVRWSRILPSATTRPRREKARSLRLVALRCPVQSNQLKDHAASESAVVRTTAILTYEKVATAGLRQHPQRLSVPMRRAQMVSGSSRP
jgi:hypothetical protein